MEIIYAPAILVIFQGSLSLFWLKLNQEVVIYLSRAKSEKKNSHMHYMEIDRRQT